MLKIGLTGGIGSGKTTVANMFAQLGATVIDADKIAHEITATNTDQANKIVKHFGKDFLQVDGALNRRKLRKIVFQIPQERKWLENLLHPMIRQEIKDKIAMATTPYCILVIPLLTKSSHYHYIDRILVVDAPEELQIKRAAQREKVSEADITAIIKSQTARKERLAIADDIIVNDGAMTDLHSHVEELHHHYLKLANEER